MQKIIPLFSILLVLTFTASHAGEPVHPKKNSNSITQSLTVNEFLNLTPESAKDLLGRELKFKERLGLKLNQKRLSKQLAKNPSIGNDYRRHTNFWIGLLIGVIVVLIIVIIVSS